MRTGQRFLASTTVVMGRGNATGLLPLISRPHSEGRGQQMALTISDWAGTFENAESRKRLHLHFVLVPTDLTSIGYCRTMAEPDGTMLLGVWGLLLRLAARAEPREARGSLTRANGTEHTAETLSLKTRCPAEHFNRAIPFFISIGWLVGTWSDTPADIPAEPAKVPAEPAASAALNRTEQNGTEQDRTETAAPKGAVPRFEWSDTDARPTPKDVLKAWDVMHHMVLNEDYVRTAGSKEAALAAKLITAVGGTKGKPKPDVKWQRIPEAMEQALHDAWAQDKGFSVFAAKFNEFDLKAKGGGTRPGTFDPVAYAAGIVEGD